MATQTPDVLSQAQQAQMVLDELHNLQRQAFAAKLAQARVGAGDDGDAAAAGAAPGVTFGEYLRSLDQAIDRVAKANSALMPVVQELADRNAGR